MEFLKKDSCIKEEENYSEEVVEEEEECVKLETEHVLVEEVEEKQENSLVAVEEKQKIKIVIGREAKGEA